MVTIDPVAPAQSNGVYYFWRFHDMSRYWQNMDKYEDIVDSFPLILTVRDIDMIDDTIISLFEKFSDKKGFEYYKESLPYRPYGETRGTIDDGPFKKYIYQSESQASRGFDSICMMC